MQLIHLVFCLNKVDLLKRQFSLMASSMFKIKRTIPIIMLATILTVSSVRADNDALMRFAGNIHQFNELFPQEKVYLQFDNTAYFQGDDIWFKAFVVKSSNLCRSESGVLYVELLSPSGVLLQQQKLKIVAGQADGRIQLVDYATEQARELRGVRPYPSGFYEVRAYTQYMLNFDPDIIFSRVLPVYQTPDQEGDYSNPAIASDSSIYSQNRPPQEKLRKVNVAFYPEGGNMISGLPCRVAFKAVDDKGSGIIGKLTIETDEGHKILTESGHEGMGSFELIPGKKRVDGTFEYDGKKYSVTLPLTKSSGYTMKADIADKKNSLKIEVNRTQTRNEATIGMTVTCRGELVTFEELSMDGNVGKFSFNTKGWPAGVCRIVLFTDKGEVLAARSVYNGNLKYVPPTIEVKPDKRHYDAFGKMQLSFQLKDKNGKPFRDRFCISVRDAGDYGSQYSDNLLTDLLLTSDLKGFIHNPSYYFESSDKQHLKNLDLLCMVQGWERYDWEYMTDNKVFTEKRRIETGLTLNGTIMSHRISRDRTMDDVKVYVAISPNDGEYVEYGQFVTDKNGYFGFDMQDFYGKADLTMRLTKARNANEPNAKIRLERAQLPELRAYNKQELQLDWSAEQSTTNKTSSAASATLKDYPAIINESEGLVLPTVRIDGDRKYVDYFTFKSFDVEKDVDMELDLGKYSTNLTGYLIDKGYSVNTPVDMGTIRAYLNSDQYLINNSNYLDYRYDYEHYSQRDEAIGTVSYLSSYYHDQSLNGFLYSDPNYNNSHNDDNYFQINGHPVLCYVHDNRGFYTSGKYAKPWQIDAQDIESILLFDDLHSKSEIGNYAPEYLNYLNQYSAVQNVFAGRAGNFNDRMVLMDIKLKDSNRMNDNPYRFNLGKRVTTLQGFSHSHEFYAPEYPNGAIVGDVDYRRTLYWNPNVITDENGKAAIEFYNNSYSTKFNVSGAGITASGMPYVLDKEL